jgi:hypothetical protein
MPRPAAHVVPVRQEIPLFWPDLPDLARPARPTAASLLRCPDSPEGCAPRGRRQARLTQGLAGPRGNGSRGACAPIHTPHPLSPQHARGGTTLWWPRFPNPAGVRFVLIHPLPYKFSADPSVRPAVQHERFVVPAGELRLQDKLPGATGAAHRGISPARKEHSGPTCRRGISPRWHVGRVLVSCAPGNTWRATPSRRTLRDNDADGG